MAFPTITVSIAFDNGPFDTSPVWTDVTAVVSSISSVQRGRSREGGRWEAGSATVTLDNDTGVYTPGNIRSVYFGRLVPMRPIKIEATYSAVTYSIFYGVVERWIPSWPGGLQGVVTLECVDGFKLISLARINYSHAAEGSGLRIDRILGQIGWPASMRDTDLGDSQVTAAALVQQSPMSHIQDVVAAEDGQIWVAGNGDFVFRQRTARLTRSVSTIVQAWFGNDPMTTTAWVLGNATNGILGSTTIPRQSGFSSSTELPYLSVQPSYDDQFLVNDAEITAAGGIAGAQVQQDTLSQRQYGIRTTAATYILTSDDEANGRAAWMVYRNKDPKFRVLSVTISGRSSDSLWPIMLSLDINHRIAVTVRTANSYGLWNEYYIEAVNHRNIDNDDWQVTYSLTPANVDVFWVLGDAVKSILEVSTRLTY